MFVNGFLLKKCFVSIFLVTLCHEYPPQKLYFYLTCQFEQNLSALE